MKRPLCDIVLLASLALSAGCGDPRGAAADLPPSDDVASTGVARSALEAAACAGRRWITFDQPGLCVSSNGFTAEPLFPPAQSPPEKLEGYCLHTWAGPSAPSSGDITDWQNAPGHADRAEDCALVTPLASYEDDLASLLRTSITRRIGVVTGNLLSGPPVHVAVIDTAPDAPAGAPSLGKNRHGDTLAAMIGEVVDVPGALSTSTELAMPCSTDPSGEPVCSPLGGDYGYLSDLSRALWRAIRDHRDAHAGEHLVLNLSLGWESLGPSSSCGAGSLPAVRAVQALLDIASCQDGALVVAAAGNDMGGHAPAGGLACPAAWMAEPPSCGTPRPLVIAAYGLDYADAPIAVARRHSATPFAAPALGGVAWAKGTTPPAPLTGTSVSAAAITASIAAVWAAAPQLEGADIVDRLYADAAPLGVGADVCAPGLPGCEVRRLSPCGSLSVIGSPWKCALVTDPSGTSNPDLDPSTRAALLDGFAFADKAAATAKLGQLPSDQVPAAGGQNSVNPEPIIPVCPNCTLALGTGASSYPVLYGTLDRPVASLFLVVGDGRSWTRYAITGFTAGAPFRAFLPASVRSAETAWLSAEDATSGLSVTQQILVVE